MARVKLSALFTSMAGRYGGGVFRNWKGLTVLGVLPDAVHNPNTAKQAEARGLLTCTSKAWSTLTVTVKDAWSTVAVYLSEQWDNYANEVGSHTVIKTPRGPFTALGALVSAHSLLGSCALWECGDALIAAPVGVSAPAQPLNLAVSGDTDGIVCTWDDPVTWGDNATAGNVRVWAKSEDGTFFAQLRKTVPSGTETYTITTLVPSGGSAGIDIVPGMYFIQLDAVNAEGLRSAPSAVGRVTIAAPVPPPARKAKETPKK